VTGVDPKWVAEAIRLKLIDPADADRFLNPPPTKAPHIIPATPPPPERLQLVIRPDGRLRRTRQRMTQALIRCGVLDPTVVDQRHPPSSSDTTPPTDQNESTEGEPS
jgi:hypothetical protein